MKKYYLIFIIVLLLLRLFIVFSGIGDLSANQMIFFLINIFIVSIIFIYKKEIVDLNSATLILLILGISLPIKNDLLSYAIFNLTHIILFLVIINKNKIQITIPKLKRKQFEIFIFFIFLISFLAIMLSNPTDIGLSTLNASSNFLNGINPYSVAEPNPESNHYQNYMYLPFMFLIYAPFYLLFGSLALPVVNLISFYLLLKFSYKLVKVKSNVYVARLSTILIGLSPILIFESFFRLVNDLPVISLAIIGLYYFEMKKNNIATFIISLSIAAKFFPIIILSTYISKLKMSKQKIVKTIFIFLTTISIIIFPFYLLSPSDFTSDMLQEVNRELSGFEKPFSLLGNLIGFNTYLIPATIIIFLFIINNKKHTPLILSTQFMIIFNIFIKTYHYNYLIWIIPLIIICIFSEKIKPTLINQKHFNNTFNKILNLIN